MGRRIFTTRWFWARILHNLSEFCFSKKIMSLSLMYCPQLTFFSGDNAEKNFDCPTFVTPWSLLCAIFLPQDIFLVKRPKLSENQEIGSQNTCGIFESWTSNTAELSPKINHKQFKFCNQDYSCALNVLFKNIHEKKIFTFSIYYSKRN